MSAEIFDLIILGAGPGGYVGAIRAAQLGMQVAVIESRQTLGGVCLNEGCIPSKALLDSSEYFALARDEFALHGIEIPAPKLNLEKMLARKNSVVDTLTGGIAFLFKKHNIRWLKGHGYLLGPDPEGLQLVAVNETQNQLFKGKQVLLATGARSVRIPGIRVDGDVIINHAHALSLKAPPEHLLVIGAGYIGLELGSIWQRLGSKVSVADILPQILPRSDGEAARTLRRALKKQGLTFYLESQLENIQVVGKKALVKLLKGTKRQLIECDKVLMATGRKPNTDGFGLAELGIALDTHGWIKVDENYATSVPDIYAVGDLIPGPMLAHKASEEAVVFAERLAGKNSEVDYQSIPGVCYTWPELASVGKTEEQLTAAEVPTKIGKFDFLGNGRARAMGKTEGFVKILAHADSGEVLGVHIVAPRAAEMIAEAVAVMSYGGTAHDIGTMFHAHPTLSEAVKEAALDVDDVAVHC